jgi:hypothetical protein
MVAKIATEIEEEGAEGRKNTAAAVLGRIRRRQRLDGEYPLFALKKNSLVRFWD